MTRLRTAHALSSLTPMTWQVTASRSAADVRQPYAVLPVYWVAEGRGSRVWCCQGMGGCAWQRAGGMPRLDPCAAGPVATIKLPHMLPFGLHGSWTGAYLGPQPEQVSSGGHRGIHAASLLQALRITTARALCTGVASKRLPGRPHSLLQPHVIPAAVPAYAV